MDLQDDSIYFRPNDLWSHRQPVILSVKPDDPQCLPELEPVPEIDPVAKCNLVVHEIPLPSPEVPDPTKEGICTTLFFQKNVIFWVLAHNILKISI